jgi:hypothetical protein
MCFLIGILWEYHAFFIPMCGIQQLCGFEDHLYDMLVAMIFRGLLRVEGEEKDIHVSWGQVYISGIRKSVFRLGNTQTI